MSKITFRADEELIDRVERLDASKSEVMREALRAYLVADDRAGSESTPGSRPTRAGERTLERGEERGQDGEGTLDDLVGERVDDMLDERLDGGGQDINLTISLEGAKGASVAESEGAAAPRAAGADGGPASTAEDAPSSCGQCGTDLEPGHVHCPNCGEKATRRVFCDCGDEIRSDWAFCPSCGRRTPAADVLDSG